MKTEELAEIYAEVDDFLMNELDEFVAYLDSMGYLSGDTVNVDWSKVIKEYLGIK